MSFSIAQAIFDAIIEIQRKKSYFEKYDVLEEQQKKAVDLLLKNIKQDLEAPFVAIQGPPGTGKTTVYLSAYKKLLRENYLSLIDNESLIYLAPTNQLVFATFRRILIQSLVMYSDNIREGIKDILKSVRVFGSKIFPYRKYELEKLVKFLGLSEKEFRDLIEKACNRNIMKGDSIRLIFSTEWQRIYDPERAIHIIYDEASKSPLFRAFIFITRRIQRALRKGENIDVLSLTVLGDDRQAIALEEEYRKKKYKVLVLPYIRRLLEKEGLNEQFVFLNVTYRLPSPSHVPLREGFYADFNKSTPLSAKFPAEKRLKDLEPVNDMISIIKKRIRKTKLRIVLDNVQKAINNRYPIMIVNTRRFKVGKCWEEERGYIGGTLAALLADAIVRSGIRLDIKVIAPYTDLVLYCQKVFYDTINKYQLIEDLTNIVEFSTVHSVLGDEADIVIAVLGKEWPSSANIYLLFDEFLSGMDDSFTIYFREPELVNVQLSRHKRMLLLLGDIEQLVAQCRTLEKVTRREYKKELEDYIKSLEMLIRTVETLRNLEGKGVMITLIE